MRRIGFWLAGLILTLGFLAMPMSALAAPQITINPGSGAVGDFFTVTGAGFDPNVAYTFRVQSQDRQTTVANSTTFVQVAADGTFSNRFNIVSQRPAGTYFGEVLTADTQAVVAGATFVLTGAAGAPTATVAAPTATVAPTTVAPTATVAPTTVAPTTVAPTATVAATTTVAPTATVRATTTAPTATAVTPTVPPTVAPTMTTRPAPTATMPTMPGLPNAGGGGMSGGDGGLFVGLGLIASAAIAFGVARRRRTA